MEDQRDARLLEWKGANLIEVATSSTSSQAPALSSVTWRETKKKAKEIVFWRSKLRKISFQVHAVLTFVFWPHQLWECQGTLIQLFKALA